MADKFKACSVERCNNPVLARGYCNGHYKRLWKYGDPLGGGTSHGELLRWIHEVAILHTSNDCLIWPFAKTSGGYGTLWINGKPRIASRYVCELAHGAPPTPDHEAAHSCGKGHEACIAPSHLVWKTSAENKADKLIHGTHQRGERHGRAKITEAEAREILSMKGIETQNNLAERFGVSRQAVGFIHTGNNWSWLSEETKELSA